MRKLIHKITQKHETIIHNIIGKHEKIIHKIKQNLMVEKMYDADQKIVGNEF